MMRILLTSSRRLLAAGLCVLSGILLTGCSGTNVSRLFENGALATAAPIATDIGVRVFRSGGNAFDVAVAVGFALQVVHPEAGNIGGGGFALVRDSENGNIRALDFRETAPLAAAEDMFLDDSGYVIPQASTLGPLACGVPGTVAGLYQLWETNGSLPWDSLVRIAAALADTGFTVDQYLAESLAENREQLLRFEETAEIYFPNGTQLKAGDRLIQKDLAATLHAIAAQGPEAFYAGDIADSIVACMEKYGGLITRTDLESYRPIWRKPIQFTFDSCRVYTVPPPSSGGIVIGQILKLLERFDLSRYTSASPEFLHLFAEASRLAFADRAEHLGDPDFYVIPEGLLDSIYLDMRRSLIKSDHATSSEAVQFGIPGAESEQTTHYSVADKEGNIVAVTYTLNTAYGSKLTVGGAGFLLNNEMDDFSVKPGVPNTYGLVGGEANKIEPGKRMLSSMSPTIVMKDDEPLFVVGTPGGSKIITMVAQALVNLCRFDLEATDIATYPRFHHQWLPDILYLEENVFEITTKQGLIRRGHNIKERAPYGDLQAIYFDSNGLMEPVTDPRGKGMAGGF